MKSKNSGVLLPYTEEYMQLYLLHQKHENKRSLRDLASELEVSHGVIQRSLKGQFPKRKDLREKLNLSPLEIIEACHKCGVVHTTKRCTSTNHRPRPPRISIRLDNPESAARSIENHMDGELIRELVKLLNNGDEQ